jgi:hypothetical protein
VRTGTALRRSPEGLLVVEVRHAPALPASNDVAGVNSAGLTRVEEECACPSKVPTAVIWFGLGFMASIVVSGIARGGLK